MEWEWNGMKMELTGYLGHYIAWSKTLIALLTSVKWISHETTDESLVVAEGFILWFASSVSIALWLLNG